MYDVMENRSFIYWIACFIRIQVFYGGIPAPHHGGTGGNHYAIVIPDGLHINQIEGWAAKYVDRLRFIANDGTDLGTFGM